LIESKAGENKIANAFNRTNGLFFLFNSIMLGVFYYDRIYIFFHQGARILAEYDNANTLIHYDYYYLGIIIVAISTTLLHYSLERYVLNKEKYLLTKLFMITFLLLPFVRFAESQFGIIGSYITVGLPLVSIFIGLVNFFGQYLKLGFKAPPGSEMRRKSFMIVIGFITFLAGTFVSTNLSKETFNLFDQVDLHLLAPLGPLIFLLGIVLLWKGYIQKESS
jgi:hypothetical protein